MNFVGGFIEDFRVEFRKINEFYFSYSSKVFYSLMEMRSNGK